MAQLFKRNFRRGGFTLVELLVVIGIIALLISVLLPALNRARAQANSVKCMSNMRTIAQGMFTYTADHKGIVIPSFNIPKLAGAATNYTAIGATQAMEGWPAILDRDGYARSGVEDHTTNTVYYCPDTYDLYGMQNGQTAGDPGKPRGWVEWPMIFDGSKGGGDSDNQSPVTIPDQNYNKIIRCSYWVNAYNPIGAVTGALPDLKIRTYFTPAPLAGDPIRMAATPRRTR